MKWHFGMGKWVMMALSAMSASAMAVPITVDQLQLSEEQKIALLRQLGAGNRQAAPVAPPPAAAPGIVFGSPVAFGQFFGEAAAGLGVGTLPPGLGKRTDASLAASAGLGRADLVGLDVGINVVSLTAGFADSGSFSAKLHKLLNSTTAVAVGVESFGTWGLARQRDASGYAVATTIQRLPNGMPVALNLGVGNGRFRDTFQTLEDRHVGVFGGVALLLNQRVSLIADYTGIGWNTAVSFVPVRDLPITASVGLTNIARQDGGTREVAGAVGYRVTF